MPCLPIFSLPRLSLRDDLSGTDLVRYYPPFPRGGLLRSSVPRTLVSFSTLPRPESPVLRPSRSFETPGTPPNDSTRASFETPTFPTPDSFPDSHEPRHYLYPSDPLVQPLPVGVARPQTATPTDRPKRVPLNQDRQRTRPTHRTSKMDIYSCHVGHIGEGTLI